MIIEALSHHKEPVKLSVNRTVMSLTVSISNLMNVLSRLRIKYNSKFLTKSPTSKTPPFRILANYFAKYIFRK